MIEAKVAQAFLAAQKAFKPALKDSDNPHFKSKFVSLQGAIDAVLDALHANGFALMQPTRVTDDGRTIVVTTLLHESGGSLAGEYPVSGNGTPQGEGSGLTYARRYALMALVGIAPEDDDGNAAQQAPQPRAGDIVTPARARVANPNMLRAQISTKGQAAGMTVAEIGDDFAAWAQGVPITDASIDQLTGYLGQMR